MLLRLIVSRLSLALTSACAPSITVERAPARFVTAAEAIKQVSIGLVAVTPMPAIREKRHHVSL